MTLAGYRKERPLVLGQHTPISLAREGGLWKRIPFLRDNEGMLPPYMIVVGDRRRVIAGALPLSEHIMLQKEVTRAGWGDESGFRTGLKNVLNELKGIRSAALVAGLIAEPGANRFTNDISGMLNELESVQKMGAGWKTLSPERLSASILSFSALLRPAGAEDDPILMRIVRRLEGLADYIRADAGRVNLAIGVFEYMGRPLPLTILETQMGCSAQDINAWEALVNSREDGYMLGKTEVPAKGISVIRAGTCGGIIVPDGKGGQLEEPRIDIGDVVNATYSFADGATVRQRLGSWSSCSKDDVRRFRRAWRDSRAQPHHTLPLRKTHTESRMSRDLKWPIVRSSSRVVGALNESATELGLNCHEGGNFTKESLYLESDEERVMDLRRKYGAYSTEMEHFGLAFLTEELARNGIPAANGLISTVVGTVPGGSFAMPGSKEEEKANESQGRMLESAMRALWRLAYGRL